MVLSQLHDRERSLGDASVRVCLNAEFEPPHYCIDSTTDAETGEGMNSASIPRQNAQATDRAPGLRCRMGAERMTYHQVSDLIGAMRNFSKPKPAAARR